jgi:hypothetical protein
MSTSRKRRGSASQRIAADYLRAHGWPYATAIGAGESGIDIQHVGDNAIEVKARRNLDLPGWMRQAKANAGPGQRPILIVRGNGQGPVNVGDWSMILALSDGAALLRDAETLSTVCDALADRDDHDTIAAYIADRGRM